MSNGKCGKRHRQSERERERERQIIFALFENGCSVNCPTILKLKVIHITYHFERHNASTRTLLRRSIAFSIFSC